MKDPKLRQQLRKLLDQAHGEAYDFAKKVQPIFEINKWEWRGEGVPNAFMISETLANLIENLWRRDSTTEEGFGCTSSGRLQVRVTNYSELVVSLELVPESKRIYSDLYDKSL